MTKLQCSFKKWANGSSTYEVFMVTDYNIISERSINSTIGYTTKQKDGYWNVEGSGKRRITRTRKEGVNLLAQWFYESQGYEVSFDYLGNFTITEKEVKECMMCGNTNPEEVVEMEMFSDQDGNEVNEMVHICGEDVGCNKVDKQVVCDGCGKVGRESHMKVINGWKDCEECQEYHDEKNEIDEYVHTSPRVDRKGMYTADIYNATQDRFYATVTWSTLNGLRQKLNEMLSKLNAGDLS